MNAKEIRARIKARADKIRAPIPLLIAELGPEPLYIKTLTGAMVDSNMELLKESKDKRTLAVNAANFICDADGVLVFDARKPGDLDELAALDWSTLQLILDAGNNANALSEIGDKAQGKDSPPGKSS